MRNIFVLLLFLIQSVNLIGQEEYIVNIENDTLYGIVDFKENDPSGKVLYKSSRSSSSFKYLPEDLIGFYDSKKGHFKSSLFLDSELQSYVGQPLFLKDMVTGDAGLYRLKYKESKEQNGFIVVEQRLFYILFFDNNVNIFNDSRDLEEFKAESSSCTFGRERYRFNDFEVSVFVSEYLNCNGIVAFSNVEDNTIEKGLQIVLGAGYYLNSWTSSQNVFDGVFYDPGNRLELSLSALKSIGKGFFIELSTSFTRFSGSGSVDRVVGLPYFNFFELLEGPSNVEINYLSFGISLRKRIGRNSAILPYLNGGVKWYTNLSSRAEISFLWEQTIIVDNQPRLLLNLQNVRSDTQDLFSARVTPEGALSTYLGAGIELNVFKKFDAFLELRGVYSSTVPNGSYRFYDLGLHVGIGF